MKKAIIIFLVLIIVLFFIILYQNTQIVTIYLLFWEVEISMLYMSILALLSLVLGYVLAKFSIMRRNKHNKQ